MRFFAVLAAVSLLAAFAFAFSPGQAQPEDIPRFHAFLQSGVGAEVSFALRGASNEAIRRSVESAARFIRNRSGANLDDSFLRRLVEMEASVLRSEGDHITAAELTDALTTTLIERIRTLTDEEVERAADAMTGDTSTTIRLRAGRLSDMPRQTFVQHLRAFRDGDMLAFIAAGEADDIIGETLDTRIESLHQALPQQWNPDSTGGLTPVQSLLLAYSTISDDPLWYSQNQLTTLMRSVEESMIKRHGKAPSSAGRLAYGAGGYIFPSPLHLVFSPQVMNRLFDRLHERSSK
jgi:hypothetical protein